MKGVICSFKVCIKLGFEFLKGFTTVNGVVICSFKVCIKLGFEF